MAAQATYTTLVSIAVIPPPGGPAPQYIATGTYSHGKQLFFAPVSWFFSANTVIDPAPSYSLTTTPFAVPCQTSGTYLVVAFAPQSPTAPSSGTLPANVWYDLVTGRVQSEGGFVAGTTKLVCP